MYSQNSFKSAMMHQKRRVAKSKYLTCLWKSCRPRRLLKWSIALRSTLWTKNHRLALKCHRRPITLIQKVRMIRTFWPTVTLAYCQMIFLANPLIVILICTKIPVSLHQWQSRNCQTWRKVPRRPCLWAALTRQSLVHLPIPSSSPYNSRNAL